MSISDELRAAGNRLFLRESDGYGTIMSLADRIDNEMAELPKDATGKPIHIGDTVYGKDGRAYRVCGADIDETSEDSRYFIRVTNVLNVRILFKPECLTHELPDSLERIAGDIADFGIGADIDKAALEFLVKIQKRICRLAKERKDER